MTGLLWALGLFGIFISVGFIATKPRAWGIPTFSAFVGTVVLYGATLETALVNVMVNPFDKLIQGLVLTIYEWSAVFLTLGFVSVVIVTVLNGISSFSEDGSVKLWQ